MHTTSLRHTDIAFAQVRPRLALLQGVAEIEAVGPADLRVAEGTLARRGRVALFGGGLLAITEGDDGPFAGPLVHQFPAGRRRVMDQGRAGEGQCQPPGETVRRLPGLSASFRQPNFGQDAGAWLGRLGQHHRRKYRACSDQGNGRRRGR